MELNLNRREALTTLRGLFKLEKESDARIKRAKKRGFKEHEAAELVMAHCEITELIEKTLKLYKDVWPDTVRSVT